MVIKGGARYSFNVFVKPLIHYQKLTIHISPLCRAGDLHMAGTSTRENGLKETITLKWCTPRTNSVGEHNLLNFLFYSFYLF